LTPGECEHVCDAAHGWNADGYKQESSWASRFLYFCLRFCILALAPSPVSRFHTCRSVRRWALRRKRSSNKSGSHCRCSNAGSI
jgi:hypothetical protein